MFAINVQSMLYLLVTLFRMFFLGQLLLQVPHGNWLTPTQ